MHNLSVRAVQPRRIAAAGVAAVLGCLLTASIAGAHARYERSTPGSGANVAQAPQQVSITFTELLDPAGQNTIAVTGPSGANVTSGPAQISTADRHQLSVPLAGGLGPGVYTVRWHNLSAEDGEEANGEFTFGIGTTPPAAAAPAAAHTEGDEHDDHGPAVLPRTGVAETFDLAPLGALGLLLVAAGCALLARASRGATRA